MTEQAVEPARPVLVTIPRVELIHAGSWDISTGLWEPTPADLAAAVASQECPAVRRPVLKLGHVDPRFDGEPAVGYVGNLATSGNGYELVGDYVGLPAWLGDVIGSAYPDRSVEGQYDYRCQLGHSHPFVLTAVALLGVQEPGVGTLASLQDVAALYGIAAAHEPHDPQARSFRVAVTAGGTPVPTSRTTAGPALVAASVSTDDVRTSFYAGPAASNWWWVEQLYVDPAEVIAIDDEDGKLYRVPFTVSGNDVEWGEAQEVRREYVAASTSTRKPLQAWASSTESRPGAQRRASTGDTSAAPAAEQDRPAGGAAVADDDSTTPTGQTTDNVSDEQLASMREALGLAADATPADITTALVERVTAPPEPVPAGAPAEVAASGFRVPDGFQLVETSTLDVLRRDAEEGRVAAGRERSAGFDRAVSAAVGDGRIAPSQRDGWRAKLDAEGEDALAVLASLPAGLIPTTSKGHDVVTASAHGGETSTAPAGEDVRAQPGYLNWKG